MKLLKKYKLNKYGFCRIDSCNFIPKSYCKINNNKYLVFISYNEGIECNKQELNLIKKDISLKYINLNYYHYYIFTNIINNTRNKIHKIFGFNITKNEFNNFLLLLYKLNKFDYKSINKILKKSSISKDCKEIIKDITSDYNFNI